MTTSIRPLGELVEVLGGGTPSKKSPGFWGGSIPWVSPKDMKRWDIVDSIDHVTPEAIEQSACKLIASPAVLFVVRGMILAHTLPVGVTRVPVAINQDMKALVPKAGLLAEYLGFMLSGASRTLLDRVEVAGHGTRRLPTAAWSSLPIRVPDLEEQRRIVGRVKEAMSRVDDIRRLRVEVAAEAMLVQGAAITERFARLRREHKELTIGELVGSERGRMASGPFGSQLRHGDFVEDGTLVIGIANVQRDRFDPVRKWMVDDATLERLGRFRVSPGDVLVTVMGTVGRTCVVPDDIGTAVTSKHVYRIRFPTGRVLPRFVSIALNYDRETIRRLHGTAAGGVMPGLNSSKLRDTRLPIPPLDLQVRTIELADRLRSVGDVVSHSTIGAEAHLASGILRKAFAGEL